MAGQEPWRDGRCRTLLPHGPLNGVDRLTPPKGFAATSKQDVEEILASRDRPAAIAMR